MVSTRGPRYKFSEGERVLCYEPDPTKAKVLYDSKVLEVIETKDKRGRRTVEYLIHFQGWNSSWDRCVSEDFVLKDTEENRQLQRDLAEKSQLQLGAYLYRRERKSKGSASGSGSGGGSSSQPKRARHGFDDDGSSSSTQPDDGESGGSEWSSGSGGPPPPHTAPAGRAQIPIPPQLRDRLTFDYHLVVKRGKVSWLPAGACGAPCVADILESFVRWYARAAAWNTSAPTQHKQRARRPPMRPDFFDVARRLNIVREVAEGLRLYFDMLLSTHLLYKQEREQYNQLIGNHMQEMQIKEEVDSEDEESDDTDGAEEDASSPTIPEFAHLPPDPVDMNSNSSLTPEIKQEKPDSPSSEEQAKFKTDVELSEIKTERIDMCEHEKRDLGEEKVVVKKELVVNKECVEDKETVHKKEIVEKKDIVEKKEAGKKMEMPSTSRERKDKGVCLDSVARRLRSHKSATSQSEEEPTPSTSSMEPTPSTSSMEPTPSTSSMEPMPSTSSMQPVPSTSSNEPVPSTSSLEPVPSTSSVEPVPSTSSMELRVPDPNSSSNSVASSEGGETLRAAPPPRNPLSTLLDKVAKWRIIPKEGTELLPCRVYGAIHLSRLFVKLPDFLNAVHMPDTKLKMILKNIDMFVQYLEEHGEWFGESYYTPNTFSRSR